MVGQCVGGTQALVAFLCQHHDHESTGPNIFDMVPQMLVLLDGTSETEQRALELRQESMHFAAGIEAADVFFTVENVDVVARETSLQKRLDGGVGLLRVFDRSDDSIGGVRNESRSLVRRRVHHPSDPDLPDRDHLTPQLR
jgi:hypothetical protein